MLKGVRYWMLTRVCVVNRAYRACKKEWVSLHPCGSSENGVYDKVANGQGHSWRSEQQKRRASLDKVHQVSCFAFCIDASRMIVYNL